MVWECDYHVCQSTDSDCVFVVLFFAVCLVFSHEKCPLHIAAHCIVCGHTKGFMCLCSRNVVGYVKILVFMISRTHPDGFLLVLGFLPHIETGSEEIHS